MFSAIIKTARPHHWIKNLVVFAALIFAKKFTEPQSLLLAIKGFAAFCFAASMVYYINDIADYKNDQQHPVKKNRPIASGQLSIKIAVIISVLLFAVSSVISYSLGMNFFICFILYTILNFGYDLGLKNIVIIDVMILAIGFSIRATAGAAAISVPISSWLLVCTLLLALFLGLAKRRHEIVILGDDAISHRQALAHYSPYFLDQMMSVVAASTVVAYTFYTLSTDVQEKLGSEYLVLTVPFVLYGIFRYLYLIHQKDKGGNPTRLLITDIPLLTCVGLWIIMVIIILYL
ncbi:MAG: decaprenyl-phosphate phosphoribosyltransferase [candidate division Zixibacteria bacterium]|nr:decaprenyl-phosphate phosphoribosyltransferase [candidate division Zixibacteria bacterium]